MEYVTLRVHMADVRALKNAIEGVRMSGIECPYEEVFDALHGMMQDICSDEDQAQKELDERQELEDLEQLRKNEKREKRWRAEIRHSVSARLVRTAFGGQ